MSQWTPPKRSVAAWVIYDLANTIFALGVGGLYFATWFTDSGGLDGVLGITIALAMVIVIVLAPWFGALGDHASRRARYLVPTTLVAVGGTFFLASVGLTGSLMLYGLALIGFNLGGVVYDALLPDVSMPSNRGRVSGLGIAVGYVGSVIGLLVGVLLLDRYGYPTVFRTLAVLFLLFALPAFFFIEERPKRRSDQPVGGLITGIRRLAAAWRLASTYRGVVPFLIGRFLYSDAINTLIGGFLAIFVINELDFTDEQVQVLLGIAIVTAMVGGLAGGLLTDRFGPRRSLNAALYLWMVAMAAGVFAAILDQQSLAFLVGATGGLALGGTWAADRVYMTRISPPRHLGEFFGLYSTVGRFATILGPLVWGLIVTQFGLPRMVAMAALIVFVVTARVVLSRVDDSARQWAASDQVELIPDPASHHDA
jgi:UMF1 family MFS transporter